MTGHAVATGTAVVAVDLGGTSMKGSIITHEGVSVTTVTRPTPVPGALAAVVTLATDLLQTATDAGYQVAAVAVVTPGLVDGDTGVVRYASNLEWRDVPLGEALSAGLSVPVAIGHDVRAAGRAEQAIGAGRGYDDLLFVQIGTGVAAAQISRGRPITGVGGAAGEFGHIPLVAGGEQCTCGQFGCLEVYVSGAGLARRYLAAGGEARSAAEISTRVGTDPLADRVWSDAIAALAQGMVTMTLLMDPGVIILGGGFSNAGSTLLLPLREAVTTGLAWRQPAPLVVSQLGNMAGVMGAAVLAFHAVGIDDAPATWGRSRTDGS